MMCTDLTPPPGVQDITVQHLAKVKELYAHTPPGKSERIVHTHTYHLAKVKELCAHTHTPPGTSQETACTHPIW